MERKSARLHSYSAYRRYTERRLRDFYLRYLRRTSIRCAEYDIIIVHTDHYRRRISSYIKTYIFCQRVVLDIISPPGSEHTHVGIPRCERAVYAEVFNIRSDDNVTYFAYSLDARCGYYYTQRRNTLYIYGANQSIL